MAGQNGRQQQVLIFGHGTALEVLEVAAEPSPAIDFPKSSSVIFRLRCGSRLYAFCSSASASLGEALSSDES